MSLYAEARKMIDLISEKLDPLFVQYGFNIKRRYSDPSVFSETLGYEKGETELRISIGLHPHDYPNGIDVRIIKKIPGNWEYINFSDLIAMIKKGNVFEKENFQIEPRERFENALSNLLTFCEKILEKIG